MKLSCEKKVFEEAVGIASRAINNRSPLPILGHILIQAEEETINLTATDLELGMKIRIAGQVSQAGAVTCPAKLMQEIVNKLPAGTIELELDKNQKLTLTCQKSRFEISSLPAEEFPSLASHEASAEFQLPQQVFKKMIRQVGVAAASPNDESRAVMTGVLTSVSESMLTMVATDGRRLACSRQQLEDLATEQSLEVIIPARAMQEVSRLLGDEEKPLGVIVSEGQVFFQLDSIELHCRLLEGSFPDYRKVVPNDFQRYCRLGREVFLAALRRMLIMAQEKRSPHLVRLKFSGDNLELSSNTPDLGSGNEQLEVVYEGDDLLIAFNGRYLADVLTVLDEPEVNFKLQDETRSAVIQPLGDETFDYVVMPVKLRDPIEEEEERVAVGAG